VGVYEDIEEMLGFKFKLMHLITLFNEARDRIALAIQLKSNQMQAQRGLPEKAAGTESDVDTRPGTARDVRR